MDPSALRVAYFVTEAPFTNANIVNLLLLDLGLADSVVHVDLSILFVVLATAVAERAKSRFKFDLLRPWLLSHILVVL